MGLASKSADYVHTTFTLWWAEMRRNLRRTQKGMIMIRGQSHHHRPLHVKKIEITSSTAVHLFYIFSTLGFFSSVEMLNLNKKMSADHMSDQLLLL